MEKEQQTQEGLFNTIDTGSIEDNLITVDQTEEELKTVQKEIGTVDDKGDGKGTESADKSTTTGDNKTG